MAWDELQTAFALHQSKLYYVAVAQDTPWPVVQKVSLGRNSERSLIWPIKLSDVIDNAYT